ncbi:phage tail protein, partial [Clostridioides difficile]
IDMFTRLKEGIDSKKQDAVNASQKVGTDVVNKIKEFPSKFLQVGKDFVSGLANGISGFAYKVVDEAKKLGQKAADAVRKVLGIHSPSRVMAEIGKFVDEGLAQGIANNSDSVKKATEKITKIIEEETKKATKACEEDIKLFNKQIDELSKQE